MAEQYRIDVIADIQKYVKPLSELPGITKANAEKAAIALATSLGTVEGAAEQATAKIQAFNKSLIEQGVSEKAAAAASLSYAKSLTQVGATAQTVAVTADAATKKAGNMGMAVAGVGQQLSDVASQLATGTNPLTILIQQGPQAATAISMAGFSLGALLPILGPVAIAVGVLAAAWYKLSQDVAKAEEAQAKAAKTAQDAADAGARLNKMQRSAIDAEAVATGKATEKDLQLRDALAAVTAEYGPRIEASRKAIAASEAEAKAQLAVLQTSSNSNAVLQEAYRKQQNAAQAAEFHARELTGLEQQQGALLQTTTRGILLTVEKEKADKGAAKAARDRRDAIKELSDAMQAENDAAQATQRTYQGAIDAINGVERAQKQATASEGERVDMAYAATLETIAAEERKARAVSNSVAAEETIQQEAERARVAARESYNAQLAALEQKRTEEVKKQAEEQRKIEEQTANARIQLASTLAGAIGTIAATAGEHLTDEQKQAAEVVYAIQKASALAQIALNTILAVSQASTSAPAPYNVIPMAIAATQGAAQFAAAAASPPPKFHAGTLDASAGPGAARRGREFGAVLEEGEAVIPRATMQQPGAKEQAAALVSGRSPVAANEVAKGMDQSSVPYYLAQMVKALSRPIQRAQQARPGHKINYGAR